MQPTKLKLSTSVGGSIPQKKKKKRIKRQTKN